MLLLISKSAVCYIRCLFHAVSHVKTRQLWLLGEEKQKSEIVMITEEQQSQSEYNVFSPFLRKWFWSSDCFTRNRFHLTPDSEIISLSNLQSCAQNNQLPMSAVNNGLHVGWQTHGATAKKVPLWDGRRQSLSRVGHKLLSLPWWISLPRLLINISEPSAFPSLSSTSQPVAFHSQYYKVSFVSPWQRRTLGSIHTSPHGDTGCQQTARPWRRSKTLRCAQLVELVDRGRW